VSVRNINNASYYCDVTVGSPGLPNSVQTMYTGDATLFETTNDGMFEVRLLSSGMLEAEFLITQVTPRLGISGGFVSDDPNNSCFSSVEIEQIDNSIKKLQIDVSCSSIYSSAQIELINRKLDDISEASKRLGRKDWMNYVAGTLTSLCVAAAFSPEAAKELFKAVNDAFLWLFNNALCLL
ncbi:MAG: hypothetical protein OEX82_06765, partial [Nitrosomonas sp.]|nr:hypothetical protein [Nitrosomonas sp.]